MINNIAPAQLWVGSPDTLNKKVTNFLQKTFCDHQGCGTCHICKNISDHQHHNLIWLSPEKQYTLKILEPIFETIAFANEPGQLFFFILEKADLLTTACANSLLKSVEEPPFGYHFIFLSQRQQAILPTIKSRCVTKAFQEEDSEIKYKPFLRHFKAESDPTLFLQTLDNTNPNEFDSLELIDSLFQYWSKKYCENKSPQIEEIVTTLQQAIKKTPMPGGSKIFWKNLYIKLSACFHTGKQS